MLLQRPQIILLRDGTDTSQGKGQLISNINACCAVADVIRSTLGPCGMDKLIHDKGSVRMICSCSTARSYPYARACVAGYNFQRRRRTYGTFGHCPPCRKDYGRHCPVTGRPNWRRHDHGGDHRSRADEQRQTICRRWHASNDHHLGIAQCFCALSMSAQPTFLFMYRIILCASFKNKYLKSRQ